MSKNENQTDSPASKRKKTILIFGVSSFVGSNLAEFLKQDYRVIGTYFKNKIDIPGVLTISCDVLVREEVQLALYAFQPDYAIYSVGMSSIVDCQNKKNLAEALNTSGLVNVSEFAGRYKCQVVYLSSSYVFGGDERNYIEIDIPDANTIYGKNQSSAEFYLQKNSLNYLIMRNCVFYGRSVSPLSMTWLERVERTFLDNKSIQCDHSVAVGFLDVAYLAILLKICFDKKIINRLFQVSSQDIMTYYQFTKKYCEVFGYSDDLVIKSKWPFPVISSKEGAIAGDDLFYKLDIANVEGNLNLKLPSVEESLKFTYKRFYGADKSSRRQAKGKGVTFI